MQRKESRKERRNIRMKARAKVNPCTCKMKKRRDETKGGRFLLFALRSSV